MQVYPYADEGINRLDGKFPSSSPMRTIQPSLYRLPSLRPDHRSLTPSQLRSSASRGVRSAELPSH
jgi:hypothetical protein